MRHLRPWWLLVLVVSLLVPAMASGPSSAQSPETRLRDYGLILGDQAETWWVTTGASEPRHWVGMYEAPGVPVVPPPGRWSVTDVRLVADRFIDLHVIVEPPEPALVPGTTAGAAVLFTTLSLYGGFGGDVGYQRFVSIQHIGLPACIDPCRFEADVRVDVGRLPRIARRVDRLRLGGAAVGFVLVRTFADGTWLQAIPSYDLPGQTGWSGTLGEPTDWIGQANPVGLFPRDGALDASSGPNERPVDYLAIVDAVLAAGADPSQVVPSTDVRVIATFEGCDEAITTRLHTADGDDVILAAARRRDHLDRTVRLPVGSVWWVAWAEDPSSAFLVGETPLLIAADLTCDQRGRHVRAVTVAEITDTRP